MPALFCLTVFAGAMLLFLMEPFVGKSLLPMYGGTPAVWNTCVFFFQFMLLTGYVCVYFLHRFLSFRSQLMVFGLMLIFAAVTLPLRVAGEHAALLIEQPVLSLLRTLSLSAGPPFLVLSMTAPLAQAWYARVRPLESPYWLYVASNAGSMAALFAYPVIIEDWLALSEQSSCWSVLFVVFVCMAIACGVVALLARRDQSLSAGLVHASPAADEPGKVVTWGTRLGWVLLSMGPSSLMLGVTIHLATEIAPIPLLWVLPLAVYLLSFMIAFANPPLWLTRLSSIGFFTLVLVLAVSGELLRSADVFGVVLHVATLFLGATAIHSRLAGARPEASKLTEYYLWISAGGLCGGIFNSLVSPLIFDSLVEYPLAMAAGLLLAPWCLPVFNSRPKKQFVCQAVLASMVLIGLFRKEYFSEWSNQLMHRERTFYGPFTIIQGKQGLTRLLSHGTTVHGMQNVGESARSRRPALTYYFWSGPAGDIFIAYRRAEQTISVGVVGLGVGSLAGYGDSGQSYSFYEIDPAIERVARNPKYFTYLDDAAARGVKIRVEIGDARIRLADAPERSFGILVLDAFSSDAIPVHLLTKEAVSLYLGKLNPNGFLAFHISNTYVDLEPVLANLAADLGQVALIRKDVDISREEEALGKKASTWVVMAPNVEILGPLISAGKWTSCKPKPSVGIWTDDRSSLLRVMGK